MGVARWPKNVTTRERAAARSADTPAESRNRHAPTWHFAGIRPRRVTNTRSTATRNVPRQQHVVVEHVYRPVDEPDPVGHGGDPECAHCLGAGSDYRRCDPDHQAIDERQRGSRPQSGRGGRTVDAAGAGRDDSSATRRMVRSGSSVITVPTPTSTASHAARSACACSTPIWMLWRPPYTADIHAKVCSNVLTRRRSASLAKH